MIDYNHGARTDCREFVGEPSDQDRNGSEFSSPWYTLAQARVGVFLFGTLVAAGGADPLHGIGTGQGAAAVTVLSQPSGRLTGRRGLIYD